MHSLTLNGETVQVEVDPRTPFLEVLRETLGLTGTKYGCGEGECGACTILVDGKPVCSCLTLTGSIAGSDITTMEGLANDPLGTRLIHALAQKGAVQCGFCIPGFILSARALLSGPDTIDDKTLRDGLSGNLCRCTGYVKIAEAVSECATEPALSPAIARSPAPPSSLRIGQDYWRPASLDELHKGIADFAPVARFIAGGTDLMVQFEHRLHDLAIIDLSGLDELRGIEESDAHLRIGATTSWSEIRRSALVAAWAPVLPLAAAEVGAAQIQSRGTIGGNIVNASPAADGLPALHVHEAEVEIASREGIRRISIADVVTGPRRTALAPGEVVTAVLIPRRETHGTPVYFFEKVGPRKAQTITKGSVAFHAVRQGTRLISPRIAMGAVGPVVLRGQEAEALLAQDTSPEAIRRAGELVSAAARPIDDLRSTADYRRSLVGGLLIRGLAKSGFRTI